MSAWWHLCLDSRFADSCLLFDHPSIRRWIFESPSPWIWSGLRDGKQAAEVLQRHPWRQLPAPTAPQASSSPTPYPWHLLLETGHHILRKMQPRGVAKRHTNVVLPLCEWSWQWNVAGVGVFPPWVPQRKPRFFFSYSEWQVRRGRIYMVQLSDGGGSISLVPERVTGKHLQVLGSLSLNY